jgi:hypothetical protein
MILLLVLAVVVPKTKSRLKNISVAIIVVCLAGLI